MKPALVALLFISCFACKEKATSIPEDSPAAVQQKILKTEFQSILDTANVIGAIVIYDLHENSYYSNDFEWANTGQLPASTFKIANTIIGLETGVIESDSTLFEWDGERKAIKTWEQDLVLTDAFKFSCVPCYQEVARKIGVTRMNAFVEKLYYGDLEIDATTIDSFWLLGESRINQMQQIDFLKRLYRNELPIAARTEKILRTIMLIEETDAYTLRGKSGLSNENGNYNGWFVGYLELENKPYFFATNIEPKKELDFDFNAFIKKRWDVTRNALKEMQLLSK